ncbi:hypothetical protein ACFQX7_37875 [Luedemannella flava]
MRREDLVRALAEAVEQVPGVARLHPGTVVEVATHFAGGKVVGVRLGDPVEIHIVADRVPLPPVAAEVAAATRRILAAAGDDRQVTVVVDDVVEAALERRR